MKLSDEQQGVLDRCLKFHKHGNKNNVLVIKAGAGTGKTTIIKALWDAIDENDNAVLCATTNEAAQIINGMTVHKTFGIRVGHENYPDDRNRIFGNGYTCIIDEFSLLPQVILNRLREDKTLKLILVGDPEQLTVEGVPDISQFEYATLTHNFRAGNKEIAKFCEAISKAIRDDKKFRGVEHYSGKVRAVKSHREFLDECHTGDEVLVTAYRNVTINRYIEATRGNPNVKVLTVHKAQGKSFSKVCVDFRDIMSSHQRQPNRFAAPPLEYKEMLRLLNVACGRAIDEIILFTGGKREWNYVQTGGEKRREFNRQIGFLSLLKAKP